LWGLFAPYDAEHDKSEFVDAKSVVRKQRDELGP